MLKKPVNIIFKIFLVISIFSCASTTMKDGKLGIKNRPSNIKDIQEEINKVKSRIIEERGNLFFAKKFNENENIEREMQKNIKSKNLKEATEIGLKALDGLIEIYKETKDSKEKISYLQNSIEKQITEAEKNDAYIWIPNELDEVNRLYFEAVKKFKNYELKDALETYSTVFNRAQQALTKAKEEKASRETDERMYLQLKALEDAAQFTIRDENKKIITPAPWDGKNFINKKSGMLNMLNTYSLAKNSGAIVLSKEEEKREEERTINIMELLERARELWAQGAQARNAKNYKLANALFIESAKYLDLFRDKAEAKVYVIKVKDTLWDISKDFYKDPFLWPKIWFRNKAKIKNPDKIEPKWEIVIPRK